MSQWEKTFGKLYRGLIAQGVLTVMSAHIALPAYLKSKRVPEGLQRLLQSTGHLPGFASRCELRRGF